MSKESKNRKSRREASPLETQTPGPQAAAPRGRPRNLLDPRLQLLGSLVLASLVILAYSNSFQADWHFDDNPNIIDNLYIQRSSLTPSSLLRAMIQDRQQNRPFSNLSFALNYYFNQKNVWGYHLVNLGLHLLASLAAFWALRLTFRRAGLPPDRRDPAALLAAAAWAVHPIQTQAVTYIVQRQAVMASALMLCAFAAYIAGRETREPRPKYFRYGLAIIAWIGAVGAKEIALVIPPLILLYEFYFFQPRGAGSLAFLRRRRSALVLALIGIALFSAIYLRPAMWAKIISGYQWYPFTLSQRLLTEPRVLFQYLGLILWPLASQLSVEHDPVLSTSIFHPWTTLPAILLWLLLLAGAIRYARRFPLLSFALLWYLGNLFLESSFLPLDLMFEHRLYLPSLAVIGPLAAAPMLYLPRRRGAGVIVAAVAALLLLGTVSRNQVWQTEFSLWRDCVRKVPFKARPYLYLGIAYYQEADYNQALRAFSKALKLYPNYAEAYYHRGIYYQEQTQLDLALADFSKALELNPQYFPALNNRGLIYRDQGQTDRALQDYNRALELDPNYVQALNNRGVLYYRNQGQMDRALKDFNRVLELDPSAAIAYFNRANIYYLQGQYDRAIADYSIALELNPNYADAYFNRGQAYYQKGDEARSQADLIKAGELNPALLKSPSP